MKALSFVTGVFLVASLTMACFIKSTPLSVADRQSLISNGPSLIVTNTGLGPIKVYIQSSFSKSKLFLKSIESGETVCVYLPRSSDNYNLIVKNMDGESISPPFVPVNSPAWIWKLAGDLNFDVLSLRPYNERCKP